MCGAVRWPAKDWKQLSAGRNFKTHHLFMVTTVLEIVLCILVFFSGFDHVQE